MKFDYFFYYWGPFLLKSKVSESLRISFLEEGKKLTDPANSSLAGQIKEEYFYSKEFIDSHIDELKFYIDGYINILGKEFRGKDVSPYTLEFDDIWLNKQVAGEYNPIHAHTGDISFVFYTSIPEEIYQETNNTTGIDSGVIEFRDKLIHSNSKKNSVKSLLDPITTVHEKPTSGDIFIFPSYLFHQVQRFTVPGVERKSVAGNVKIKENL